ncbi:hypothetical protein ES703_100161 [subsurface metagenome]
MYSSQGSERFTDFDSRLARRLYGRFTRRFSGGLGPIQKNIYIVLEVTSSRIGRICDINHIIRANNVINVSLIRC